MTPIQQLTDAGFTVVASHMRGKWIEVITPGGDAAVIARQNAHCFHCFGKEDWTASGHTPAVAHLGGLGDVLDTPGQESGYRALLRNAPEYLTSNYDALYRASSYEFNRR